jgi:hypothetical protein
LFKTGTFFYPNIKRAPPILKKLNGDNFLLQQDNNTKHSSKQCNNYLGKKQPADIPSMMEWPAQSTDINPTELLWEQLDSTYKVPIKPIQLVGDASGSMG